jgi:formylglycine-generating enzyme required for sulfatase activity
LPELVGSASDWVLGRFPDPWEDRVTSSVGAVLILVKPGRFQMGSPSGESGRDGDERRVGVTLTRPFYLATTEVTQRQWFEVMGTRPWQGEQGVKQGDQYPATFVSWDDALAFCKKLSERERKAGRLPAGHAYRLPTEAEWEYACRAGSENSYGYGNDSGRLSNYAWFDNNAVKAGEKYAHQVARKRPNRFGLHDAHGKRLGVVPGLLCGKAVRRTGPAGTTQTECFPADPRWKLGRCRQTLPCGQPLQPRPRRAKA